MVERSVEIQSGTLILMERNSRGVYCKGKVLQVTKRYIDNGQSLKDNSITAKYLNPDDCDPNQLTFQIHDFWIDKGDIKYVL